MIIALVGLFLVALVLCGGLAALAVQSIRLQLRDDQGSSAGTPDSSPTSSPSIDATGDV